MAPVACCGDFPFSLQPMLGGRPCLKDFLFEGKGLGLLDSWGAGVS